MIINATNVLSIALNVHPILNALNVLKIIEMYLIFVNVTKDITKIMRIRNVISVMRLVKWDFNNIPTITLKLILI
jgi:hypothetical protein